MEIKQLKNEYATQDNRGTTYPIYVQVQEKHCVGVMADGYSPSCLFGDGEVITKYKHPDCEEPYEDKDELLEYLKDSGYQEDGIEEVNLGYIWIPVEFFLTIKGAEEYIEINKHNHGELRTYVSNFDRRNYEMRELLENIGLRTN
ncbi:hypothetical protein EKK58_09955 [Candidatus Dependentiae bacterium]|nr:MAG: hypothetical protein EKK58_09955 [Candidatus Dependentiae bacterium]